jgi:hypothetical protein
MKWEYYNETSDELDHFGFFFGKKLKFFFIISYFFPRRQLGVS